MAEEFAKTPRFACLQLLVAATRLLFTFPALPFIFRQAGGALFVGFIVGLGLWASHCACSLVVVAFVAAKVFAKKWEFPCSVSSFILFHFSHAVFHGVHCLLAFFAAARLLHKQDCPLLFAVALILALSVSLTLLAAWLLVWPLNWLPCNLSIYSHLLFEYHISCCCKKGTSCLL